MTIRHDLDGSRRRRPNDGAIYLIDQGRRRHIPDVITYNNLFLNWKDIIEDPEIDKIDAGSEVNDGAFLCRGFGETKVYLADQGQKRWVKDVPTVNRYDFDLSKVSNIPQSIVEAIPTGETIQWPEPK